MAHTWQSYHLKFLKRQHLKGSKVITLELFVINLLIQLVFLHLTNTNQSLISTNNQLFVLDQSIKSIASNSHFVSFKLDESIQLVRKLSHQKNMFLWY